MNNIRTATRRQTQEFFEGLERRATIERRKSHLAIDKLKASRDKMSATFLLTLIMFASLFVIVTGTKAMDAKKTLRQVEFDNTVTYKLFN